MKSSLVLLPAVLLAGALSGCGQTGDLYMPTPPSRPASAPVPAPVEQLPQPVPSNTTSTPAPHR